VLTSPTQCASQRFAARSRGVDGAFVQDDLAALPMLPGSVDVIFSEGVLPPHGLAPCSFRRLAGLLVVCLAIS
jgi:hypothetical protein